MNYTEQPSLPSADKRWKIVEATARRYGREPHALIETLHTVQESFGYLDETALRFVAGSLRLRKNVGKGLDKVDIQQPSLSSSGEAPHNRKLPQTFRDRRTTSPRTGLVLM